MKREYGGIVLASAIAWVDFDEAERDRARRLMDLFREQDSRDELGLGAIRDSIADHLFPGTSTIQTRLRYMLFVPWIFDALPSSTPHDAARQARSDEVRLRNALVSAGASVGIIGRDAGSKLKRLPSSVYWSGLESWGIRLFPGSIEAYFATQSHWPRERAREHVEDDQSGGPRNRSMWHERLPKPPANWLESIDFTLTDEEAGFLVERLVERHPASLLTYLAKRGDRAKADAIWQHPYFAGFPPDVRRLVTHAKIFSGVMLGAALLYNLLLSELRGNEEWVAGYESALAAWRQDLDMSELAAWRLEDFWNEIRHPAHQVLESTRRFVTDWVDLVRASRGLRRQRTAAAALVSTRERRLKKAQSRFANRSARDRWQGASGVGRLQFRWPVARSHLRDLAR